MSNYVIISLKFSNVILNSGGIAYHRVLCRAKTPLSVGGEVIAYQPDQC